MCTCAQQATEKENGEETDCETYLMALVSTLEKGWFDTPDASCSGIWHQVCALCKRHDVSIPCVYPRICLLSIYNKSGPHIYTYPTAGEFLPPCSSFGAFFLLPSSLLYLILFSSTNKRSTVGMIPRTYIQSSHVLLLHSPSTLNRAGCAHGENGNPNALVGKKWRKAKIPARKSDVRQVYGGADTAFEGLSAPGSVAKDRTCSKPQPMTCPKCIPCSLAVRGR